MKINQIVGVVIGIAVHVGQAGTVITEQEKYTYDADGNIVEKQIGDLNVKFQLDGNRIIGDSSGSTYEYDSAGRLIGESRDGKIKRGLRYQYGGKVTQVSRGECSSILFYNAEGHLVGSKGDGQTEALAWDGLGLIMRGGKMFVNEKHACGGVPLLCDGSVTVSDHLGSSLCIGRNSFAATAFGQGLEEARFTGKIHLPELEAFVFKYRNYSAAKGRWLSADPSGYPDGKNNFAYGNNEPLSNIDRLGLTFFHFNNVSLDYFSGSGYGTKTNEKGETVGDVTWGQVTTSYAAVSNSDPQDQVNGRAPNGWYTLGSASLVLGDTEKDSLTNGTWTQGTMSKWGQLNQEEEVEDYAGQTATNAIYQDLLTTQWKIHYGANFDGSRLAPDKTRPFDQYQARTYSSLKVHPDGRSAGTSGCIGISTYEDCADFISKLATYGGQQLLIPET